MSAVVAWCEHCQREVPDTELADDGTCPRCGTAVRADDGGEDEGEDTEARRPVPWTFKLMIVATVVYLGYRAYQGIAWVVHHA